MVNFVCYFCAYFIEVVIYMRREFCFKGLIIVGVLCLFSTSGFSQLRNINDVRNKIFYSEFNLDKSLQLISDIKSLNLTDPIIKAYVGATEMLAAKYSWNPISKISFLKNGINKVNEAVSNDTENIEIRFLRFYIENSLPKYLGLSHDLSADKEIIIRHLENLADLNITKDIALYINEYMIDSGQCSKEEIEQITKSIAKLQFEEKQED